MFGDDILVRTLLLPPRLPRRWLARERLDRLLSSVVEYPLTVVKASAGYGKSTALASFVDRGDIPSIWYTLGEGCDDPLVFLVHLVQAFRTHSPRSVKSQAGERALAILQHGGSGEQVWSQALDSLVNDLVPVLTRETALILDDYHTVDDRADIRDLIERLIAIRPPLLHLVLSTRRLPQLACIHTLQVRGELLEIDAHDLAFTQDEIGQLFNSAYGHGLRPEEAPAINEQTEGWAIALQLVWQSLQSKTEGSDIRPASVSTEPSADSVLRPQSTVLENPGREALFAYLAREVLARQPSDIQSFLLRSSILSDLAPAACDRVLGIAGSAAWMEALYRRGLFLTASGGGSYRYHPLFHSFLQERAVATLPEWDDLHLQAAEYYREVGAGERVLYHLLATGDVAGAALELERWTPVWLESGRLVTLLAWIDQLTGKPYEGNVLEARPQLLIARGDAARLLARFDMAQQAYDQAGRIYKERKDAAGQAQALRGQARVYLDTVQPVQADALLREAFRLLLPDERTARADLLGLIAENRLNLGKAGQALRLYSLASQLDQAASFRSEENTLFTRILLRLGRLAEARERLEASLPRDRESVTRGRPSEAHREITLLLALISALGGDPAAALRYSQEGLEAAHHLGSTLFEAGARICAGHALQLARPQDYRIANEYYLQAIALADAFHVNRTKAEAYLGLALLHGFRGDVAAAEDAAREGLSIVERSGDEWTAAQLWTALGAVAIANGSLESQDRLEQALKRYRTSRDTYGQAVVHLWLAVAYYRAGDPEQARCYAIDTFELVQRHEYEGLLTAPTLFGPRDRMMLVPILLAARSPDVARDPSWVSKVQALLNRGYPEIAADHTTQSYHPGVTLRIQTFGPLRVWRGNEEVGPHEWQRKKAQQMLALLLINRDRWLLREQICDWLWPEEGSSEAEAQFKVTLNALNAALEPLRPARVSPFYIRRQGGAYRFYPPGGVSLDVAEFEAQLAVARAPSATIKSTQRGLSRDEEALDSRYAALTRAVELHQGEYLGDWLYEDWARDERTRLEACYMEAATMLAQTLVERNELSEAVRLCESVLMRDPGWEDAYCVLMSAYSKQGQRSMALATYERCVRNLREYLDVEPLPTTTRIYEGIKA